MNSIQALHEVEKRPAAVILAGFLIAAACVHESVNFVFLGLFLILVRDFVARIFLVAAALLFTLLMLINQAIQTTVPEGQQLVTINRTYPKKSGTSALVTTESNQNLWIPTVPIAATESNDFVPGSQWQMSGTVTPVDGTKDQFVASLGANYSLQPSTVTKVSDASDLLTIVYGVSNIAKHRLAARMSQSSYSILSAVAFQDPSSLDQDTKNQLKSTGLYYLLAFSGIQFYALLLAVEAAGVIIPIPRQCLTGIATLIGIGCIVATGFHPVTIRAVGIWFFAQMAPYFGRTCDRASTLCLLLLIQLIFNSDASLQAGFQLSSLVFAGIVVLESFYRRGKILPAFFAPISAAPFIAYQFGTFSIFGFLFSGVFVFLAGLIPFAAVLALLPAWCLGDKFGEAADLLAQLFRYGLGLLYRAPFNFSFTPISVLWVIAFELLLLGGWQWRARKSHTS